MKVKYSFKGKPWRYAGPAGWYFVSFPIKLSKEIRDSFRSEEQGWGRLKATAKIGNTEWETAIWFDSKMNTYLLPLRADIRKKEKTEVDKTIDVTVWI